MCTPGGGQDSTDPAPLPLAPGVDPALGCAVALAVFLLVIPAGVNIWLPTAVAESSIRSAPPSPP
ncbi:hypothetical protein [Arthrobacter sp. ok362]|uniref:hypothetical protein n=1 Tax=Arthrobacter sp. ok362 TaxID=1761745 RepID=UPI00111456BB|nr:hypothetical protein [Arthrobacter sp. ok362]